MIASKNNLMLKVLLLNSIATYLLLKKIHSIGFLIRWKKSFFSQPWLCLNFNKSKQSNESSTNYNSMLFYSIWKGDCRRPYYRR